MIKEVFLDSDTDVSAVSALWGGRKTNPTPMDYAAETRAIAAADGGHRAMIHGVVMPNEEGALEFRPMFPASRTTRVLYQWR